MPGKYGINGGVSEQIDATNITGSQPETTSDSSGELQQLSRSSTESNRKRKRGALDDQDGGSSSKGSSSSCDASSDSEDENGATASNLTTVNNGKECSTTQSRCTGDNTGNSDVNDAGTDGSATSKPTSSSTTDDSLLTKAKLFAQSREDGGWIEVGIGLCTILVETSTGDDENNNTDENGQQQHGPEESNKSGLSAMFEMMMLSKKQQREDQERRHAQDQNAPPPLPPEQDDDDDEDGPDMLLRTPVSINEIYHVQRDTIIVWEDPVIGQTMAVSFTSANGCKHIMDAIRQFQRMYRNRNRSAEEKEQHNDEHTSSSSRNGRADERQGSNGGRGRQGSFHDRRHSSANNSDRLQRGGVNNSSFRTNASNASNDDIGQSPWAVRRENLPALVLAASDNKFRFAHHIQQNPEFFNEILVVYNKCCGKDSEDIPGKNHIAKLTMALLSHPFNTEQRILTQLVSQDAIFGTLDIVQHWLMIEGKRTSAETTEHRLAKFSNPGNLEAEVVKVVHYIFALQSLRDLLPMHLDDGEPGGSMLGMFLMRMKFSLYNDICTDATFLPQLFSRHLTIVKNYNNAGTQDDVADTTGDELGVANGSAGPSTTNGAPPPSSSVATAEPATPVPAQEEGDKKEEDAESREETPIVVQDTTDASSPSASSSAAVHKLDASELKHTASGNVVAAAVEGGDDDATTPIAEMPSVDELLDRHFWESASFLLELTTSVKNALIPEEGKIQILAELVKRGIVDYVAVLLPYAIKVGNDAMVAKAVDLITHVVIFAPNQVRAELMKQVERWHDATTTAKQQTTTATLDSVATAPSGDSQASIPHGGKIVPAEVEEVDENTLVETVADDEHPPKNNNTAGDNQQLPDPLLRLILHAITTVTDPIALQCIHDCITAVGIGLLQKNAGPQLIGPTTVAQRQRCLKYWADGTVRAAGTPLSVGGVGIGSGGRSNTAHTLGAAGRTANTMGSRGNTQDAMQWLMTRGEEPPIGKLFIDLCNYLQERERIGQALKEEAAKAIVRSPGLGGVPGGTPSTGRPSAPRLSSAMASNEVIPFSILKVLVLLTKQKLVSSTTAFHNLIKENEVIEHLAKAIDGRTPISTKMRCGLISLASEMVTINEETFLKQLVDGGLIAACAHVLSDTKRRNNIISGAARHVFAAVHTSVTEKRAALANTASPLMSLGFSRSPFVSNFQTLDSSNTGQQADMPAKVSTYLVEHCLNTHAEVLRSIAFGQETLDLMNKALNNEEPNKTELSVVPTSTSSQISTDDYNRMLASFDEDLAAVASPQNLNTDPDEPDATGGSQFMLRRQSSLRRVSSTNANSGNTNSGNGAATSPRSGGASSSAAMDSIVESLLSADSTANTASGDSTASSTGEGPDDQQSEGNTGGGMMLPSKRKRLEAQGGDDDGDDDGGLFD